MSRPRADPYEVDTGLVHLEQDLPGSWTLVVAGAPQSHVDLDDPTNLTWEYVRRIGHAVDLLGPPGDPVRAVHLGGGALTLARYVAATRPGSRQQVLEHDPALLRLVRRELPWDRSWRIKVRLCDARDGLGRLEPGLADLLVSDVFTGTRTPAHLTSVELVRLAARALAPRGIYAANVGDGPPLAHARAQVATICSVLPYVCLLADASVLRGRRFGNIVVLASRSPLPVDALARRCSGDPLPSRVVHGEALARFASGAVAVTDVTAVDSPAPPPSW